MDFAVQTPEYVEGTKAPSEHTGPLARRLSSVWFEGQNFGDDA
jgi:hypothetical protein